MLYFITYSHIIFTISSNTVNNKQHTIDRKQNGTEGVMPMISNQTIEVAESGVGTIVWTGVVHQLEGEWVYL